MLVEERPRWYNNQKRKSCAAEADVECLIDVLCYEADEESQDARDGEEDCADLFGEPLAFEVL